ncbi:excalibur calcium-binding domain-containing protein [Actinomadura sp. KC216]|uniref:excalibur calcium-binding domain-containing protein n=1 Tax=Actinomadura sp. KC216 TaxID=2530370 RepID=UPI00105400DB|nr:excalibur calcium-binding domain-containing protein [Actinomadura sp. KC216]TDB83938.1 excalibur calcium-binding domain-containing protein [Actinomadura sp. KC216]
MPEPTRPPPGRAGRLRRGLLPVLAALAALLLLGPVTSCGSGSEESERVAPRDTSAPPATVPPSTPETPPPREPSTPEPGAADGVDPRFDTCAQANAHGYGPYYEGWDPEYHWYEDRDHDGIDCEPWLRWETPPTWSPDPGQSEPTPPLPSPSEPPTDVPPPPEPSDEPTDQEPSTEPAPPPSEEPSAPESDPPSEQEPGEPSAPGSGEQP